MTQMSREYHRVDAPPRPVFDVLADPAKHVGDRRHRVGAENASTGKRH